MTITARLLSVLVILLSTTYCFALNEVEPNQAFNQSNETFADSILFGTSQSGNDDYFFTVLPEDGAIRIYREWTNTSGTATSDIFFYAYNTNTGNLNTSTFANQATAGTFRDTLTLYCLKADTVYLRTQSTGSFSYNVRYEMLASTNIDTEPNDDFASSQALLEGTDQQGHTGHANGITTDVNDYYVSLVPADGTIEFIYEWSNTSGSTASDIWFYAYNRQVGSLGTYLQANQAFGTFKDTSYLYCVAADTVYFRVQSSGCFDYEIRYNLLPTTNLDNEPNQSFAEAQAFNEGTDVQGHVGSVNGSYNDVNDYFVTVAPTDGTVEFIYEWSNTSNATTSDLFIYAYNRQGGNLGTYTQANQPLGIYSDTSYIYCQLGDTLYFRFQGSGCFDYEFRYNLLPTTNNDIEPNNSFAEAQAVLESTDQQGHTGHGNGLSTDLNDYYVSVPTADGTVEFIYEWINTSNTSTSDLFVYAYNRQGGNLATYTLANQPLVTYKDTSYLYCVAADTVYFRFQSSGCFDYEFRYNLLASPKVDNEPNNTFLEAQAIVEGVEQDGHVGSTNGSFNDLTDYYVTLLPEAGTVEFIYEWENTSNAATSDLFVYAYGKNTGNLGTYSLVNQPVTGVFRDTSYIYCREADTMYFRVQSSGCFDYTLSYNLISNGPADVEPNDGFSEATPIANGGTASGLVGYTNNIVTDASDYYYVVNPVYGNLTVSYTATNTSNASTSDLFVYLYNGAGGLITSNSHVNNTTPISDVLSVTCTAADTFYVRFQSTGCFSYNITDVVATDEQPIARAFVTKLASNAGFYADTSNATSLTWDFDNGNTSANAFANQVYSIGLYQPVLTATKAGCNLVARDTAIVEIKGVEQYTPDFAGAGGDVAFQIYGAGLDTSTVVTITNGTDTYTLFDKASSPLNDQLGGVFDLHFATAGLYDVAITIPGEPTANFPDGLNVSGFQYPYCTAEIIGPDIARRNRNGLYTLKISNNGNVMARSAVVHVAYPNGAEVDFGDQIFKEDINGSRTITEDTSTYSFPNSEFDYWIDTASAFQQIDTLGGEPYDGWFGRFYIPFVPANGSLEIPFRARYSTNGNYEMVAYMNYPNREGSTNSPQADNFDNVYLSHTLDAVDAAVDQTKNVPAKLLVKSAKVSQRHLNLTARIGFDYLFSKYYGYEISDQQMQSYITETGKANEFAIKAVAQEALTAGVGGLAGQARKFSKQDIDALTDILATNDKLTSAAKETILKNAANITDGQRRIDNLEKLYNGLNKFKSADEKRRAILDMVAKCPELQEQLDDFLKNNNEELDHKEKRKKRQRVINSTDPNAIYGNNGIGSQRSIRGNETLHYMIAFENVDTASAAAQEVVITNQLDVNLFDVETFQFGNVYVAENGTSLGANRDEYYGEIDLGGPSNLIAKVYAKLDKSTGMIEWRFVSIDPNTGDFPADPFAGLLPPNMTSPEGEGAVTYSVELKSSVANNTTVSNQASIVFDDNAAIMTNTWTNLIDKVGPTASISGSSVNDTTIALTLGGTDNESGLEDIRLYYKTDTTDWASMGSFAAGSIEVTTERWQRVSFYVEGTDSVGNEEVKTPQADITVGIEEQEGLTIDGISIYPNPTRGEVSVESINQLGDVQLTITDIMGMEYLSQQVELPSRTAVKVDVSELPSGIYLINLSSNGQQITKKLILMN